MAFEVADALPAPLDVIVVCKLGLPDQPELTRAGVGPIAAAVIRVAAARRSAPRL